MPPARMCFARALALVAVFTFFIAAAGPLCAQQLTQANYDQLVPAGKEVDAIYGDLALQTKYAKAVVAFPAATRNSNMTVRSVGGCLIDLATTLQESDQLSAFYPGRRKFPFSDAQTDGHSITVTSPGSDTRPQCVVRYEFRPDDLVMEVTSTWTNTTTSDWTLALEDDLRADGGNEDMVKSPNGSHRLFYVHDVYWKQAYGIRADGYTIRSNGNSRETVIVYEANDGTARVMKPGESFRLTRQIIVAVDLPGVMAVNDRLNGHADVASVSIRLTDSLQQPLAGARLTLKSVKGSRGTTVADNNGIAVVELPPGTYQPEISFAGHDVPSSGLTLNVVTGTNDFTFSLPGVALGAVAAAITDGEGRAIPAKVEFIGSDGSPTPNWGPVSAEHFVRNLAYTEDGTFTVPLRSGSYDVIVSHGAEYDAVFTKIKVDSGQTSTLTASLRHSVKTPGWVSSDFHSHSSPSGDNTGSQKGRVLNLAAEHIEFAPCTEHNRVSSYDAHIAELGLRPFLATVTGMELTGQPLPLNHQNVFPMKHTPRTQDGGGPVTDSSPETQIERIALWDDRSDKLIQQNHPDIGWLFYDKNGDGTPDGGYSRSFPLMDVMEIHPIDRILNVSQYDERDGKRFGNNRMLNWLQLLNHGHRIYGVVNTDAHYNFHGSGWLRNWIQSGTDDPAKIDPMQMVRASQQGRLIMSNGPYLEATFQAVGSDASSTLR